MDKDEKVQPAITWRGYEFEYREKTPDWYWAVIIISLGVIVAAVLFGNYLFAVMIAAAGFSIIVQAGKKPAIKEFRVDEKGIRAGGKLYPYQNIESFWINEKKFPPELFLEIKRLVLPVITVPLNTTNIPGVRAALKTKIEEKEHAVPVSQKISDYIGF